MLYGLYINSEQVFLQEFIAFTILSIFSSLNSQHQIFLYFSSFLISIIIVTLSNLAIGQFKVSNILLYVLSSVFISMNANGIYDFDTKSKTENKLENKEIKDGK